MMRGVVKMCRRVIECRHASDFRISIADFGFDIMPCHFEQREK